MSLPAEILTIATNDPRVAIRRTLRLQVNAQLSGDAVKADILNLSENGLLIETTANLMIGEILLFDLPPAGITEATVVWTRGRLFGCEFQAALAKHVVSTALLRSPNERLGQDAAGLAVDLPAPEEDSFGSEIDDSGLSVLVISLVVLMLVAIIGGYALFEALSARH